MLSFHERSQVTIPRLRRSRNEISFASPRGPALQGESAAASSFSPTVSLLRRSPFSLSNAQPVGSSLFQFSLRFEKNAPVRIRHEGVYRKDFVTGRYYSVFSFHTSHGGTSYRCKPLPNDPPCTG